MFKNIKNDDEKVSVNTISNDISKKEEVTYGNCLDEDDDDDQGYWLISGDQMVRIMNRISDIREIETTDPIGFIKATYELLGTLDTIMFDERNYRNVKVVK